MTVMDSSPLTMTAINMTTVPEVVEEIVKNSPYIEKSITDGLLNLSSYARQIKPIVEKRLFKDVSEASLVMALKRLSEKLIKQVNQVKLVDYVQDIIVRSNLSEYTFANSKSLIEKHKKLLDLISKKENVFFTLSEGTFETTIIISSIMDKDIEELFKSEKQLMYLKNLSSITLKLDVKAIEDAGVHYGVFKLLAWEGINVRESVSTYTELSLIIDNELVDKAFSVLRKAII